MGDFNIIYNQNGHEAKSHLRQFEAFTGLDHLITAPTRLNNTIDLRYTSSQHVKKSGILDI